MRLILIIVLSSTYLPGSVGSRADEWLYLRNGIDLETLDSFSNNIEGFFLFDRVAFFSAKPITRQTIFIYWGDEEVGQLPGFKPLSHESVKAEISLVKVSKWHIPTIRLLA